MTTIQLQHVSFNYPGQADLFTDQNLHLDTSWHLGLTGRNGRGKTTLLNLLRGKISGSGTVHMPVTPAYFPAPVADSTQLTWQVATAATTAELWEIQRELSLLGQDDELLYRPFNSLSGGEQTRVLLAVTFATQNGFALLDEPTNHLDASGRQQVAAYLRAKEQGFIVIAHDRDFLDAYTDHTLTIERQQIVLTQGNYSAYAFAKQRRDETELAEQKQLKQDISRLQETARAKREWSGNREKDKHGKRHVKGSGSVSDNGFITARAARIMKKAKNLEKRMDRAVEDKKKLLKNLEETDQLKLNYIPDHHDVLLRVDQLQLSYGDRKLFAPVSFTLCRGDRLALIGNNGSGKSSLIAALLGQFTGDISGQIDLASSATIAWVRQQYPDNTGTLKNFALEHSLVYQDLLNNMKKLGTPRDAFIQPIETLSAGQQKKVELAVSLARPASLYIWDEPLNYLDMFNQDQLAEMLTRTKAPLIMAEHDRAFIERIATKRVYLQG